ncbi:MAG: SGNH/GDSL hydrolase family protein [Phycisphaerae bacterium]|nr:SGNH/GDSL hydrolase family protein [Phycisphaerae bacterium]
MRISSSFTAGTLLALAASLAAGQRALAITTLPYQQMVVFGDSLSDVGNLNSADGGVGPGTSTNYAVGEFTDGPLTTPAVPTGGPEDVWAQQLDNKLGLPALTYSLNGGSDYAYGGAATGGPVSYSGLSVPGMQDQVNTYLTNVGNRAPANDLYALWGGANDIFNAAAASGATTASIDAAASTAAANIDGEIASLYAAGARDFLWLNLPPLDKTPDGAGNSNLADATTTFNNAWSTDVAALNGSQTMGHVIGVNIDTLVNQIINDPSAYGLTDVTDPAQGLTGVNPDTYLFWDGVHPTTAGHALIAGAAYQQVVPEPAALSLLMLSGLGLLLLRRTST